MCLQWKLAVGLLLVILVAASGSACSKSAEQIDQGEFLLQQDAEGTRTKMKHTVEQGDDKGPQQGTEVQGLYIPDNILEAKIKTIIDGMKNQLIGPRGPAGPQGPAGPRGPAGADGADGVCPVCNSSKLASYADWTMVAARESCTDGCLALGLECDSTVTHLEYASMNWTHQSDFQTVYEKGGFTLTLGNYPCRDRGLEPAVYSWDTSHPSVQYRCGTGTGLPNHPSTCGHKVSDYDMPAPHDLLFRRICPCIAKKA